jgi:hypothetical protein
MVFGVGGEFLAKDLDDNIDTVVLGSHQSDDDSGLGQNVVPDEHGVDGNERQGQPVRRRDSGERALVESGVGPEIPGTAHEHLQGCA